MSKAQALLPLRGWLAIAVVALVALPTVTGLGVWLVVASWQTSRLDARLDDARRFLASSLDRWDDPTWQREAGEHLSSLGLEAVLTEVGSTKRTFYVTPLAQGVVTSDAAKPRIAKPAASEEAVFQLGFTGQSDKAPSAIATVFYTTPDRTSRLVAALAGGLVVLLAVLAAVSWLLGRWIVRPLAALSRSADAIAGGDLTVYPPRTRAREVASVGEAMAGMSTALRTSTERDAALDAERRFLITAIAHDLRTPLFVLRGYLDAERRGLGGSGDYLARACEKANLLERLVSDLFAFSRIEYLACEPDRRRVDLGVLLADAAGAFETEATKRGVELALDGPEEPVEVLADELMLERVLTNLLENALSHTPAGGRVTIVWRRRGRGGEFAVHDTGGGIADDDLPRLFEPLYRGDASRNSSAGGAGLGLAIARRLMEANGGTLGARNAPGAGAVFTGELPSAVAARGSRLRELPRA